MRLHVSEAESDVTSAAPRSFTPTAFASLTSLLLGFSYFVARLRRLTPLTPGAFRRSQLVAGETTTTTEVKGDATDEHLISGANAAPLRLALAARRD